jgi:nitroreductase
MTSVDHALRTRISTRAFLDKPVTHAQVHALLDAARWAPSGGNVQPWKVIAVAGEARAKVVELTKAAMGANPAGEEGDRPIYPANLWEPHRTWRYELGEQMYEKLGIGRDNKLGRLGHLARNMDFFGAPVGLFFIIDERMGHGQWAHLGMFMQSLALAAQEQGLATCMQEFWARARATLKAHLALPDSEMIYCGMALGYGDPDAPVNKLRSERAPVEAFARFEGF